MKLKSFIFLLLFFVIYNINAQNNEYDSQGIVKNSLEPLIKSQLGNNYGFNYMVLDSIILHTNDYLTTSKILDPFGTLRGCILFYAAPYYGESKAFKIEDSAVVGIYKNGEILWHSEPILSGYSMNLVYSDEINKDGKVEIILSTSEFKPCSQQRLWIISWDGLIGNIINDYNTENGVSRLIVWIYNIFDYDGDGISEIISDIFYKCELDNWYPPELITASPLVTYGWNGQKYGLWSGTKQISDTTYYPANRLKISVKCRVNRINNKLLYKYSLWNEIISSQSIGNIYLTEVDPEANISTPISKWNDWLGGKMGLINNCISWGSTGTDVSALIEPGKKMSGFNISSANLPDIIQYYVQGNVPVPDVIDSNGHYLNLQKVINDILYNSVNGYTIGPHPDSINSTTILIDTLLFDTKESLDLGWITNQGTSDKYKRYLTNTKTALLQNNISVARTNLLNILHDVDIDSTNEITSEAYALLRYNTEYLLEHLPAQPPPGLIVAFKNSIGNFLTGGSLQYYEGGWKNAINNNNGTFTIDLSTGQAGTQLKTISLRMTYEYGSQTKSNVTVGSDTIVFQTVNTQVQLKNSMNEWLNEGMVQYYAGAWRTFGTITNGVAVKELLPNNYSFRMTYAYASKDKQQNIETNPTIVFQTVAANVQLQNSLGNLIDQGTVQYYSGAWREFGTTTNGVAVKELLPNNYSFRLTYAYTSKDKQQNIETNPVVVFQTVAANVQLQNSIGNPIDQGTVQYYSGAWREFGTTINGVAVKELLPNNYSFRMTYAYASKDKQQNIETNPVFVFQTVAANVQLQNSLGNPIDQGTVQYYSGAWRDFGTTTNGVAVKELLPNNYSFRMTYAYANKDKQQNIETDPTVVFQTVAANVQLQNSLGNLIDQGTVQYYSGAWRNFGTTSSGVATKELLPYNYSFRITYEYISNDKTQDISTNNTVNFSTVLCTISVKDAQNNPINDALASYYSGAWRQIGNTVNGEITKELLPANLTFRVKQGPIQQDKQQNIGTNNLVEFNLP